MVGYDLWLGLIKPSDLSGGFFYALLTMLGNQEGLIYALHLIL